ncbi:MAG TPA: hypothetical protein VHD90_02770 [Phototrophicaceae bacterium]|nr:hypothetical protein [Phototrophicaceae bacterium]
MLKKAALLVCLLVVAGLVLPASAGSTVISDNSGSGNATWHITDEPSLVINGFDLNSLGIQRPAVIDKISIDVVTPIPGSQVTVVVYGDNNGGSPSDATLDGQEQVSITQAGTFTATLATPITVNQPVVWVGFYLPVGFAFNADTSGSSVLTYWAWTPGGTFDLTKLSSAQVLGPSDGTAPVNLNLKGKARITAEITGAGQTPGTPTSGTQTPNGGNVNMGVMSPYSFCQNLSYDTGDIYSSLLSAIATSCQTVPIWESPASPAGYTLKGSLYDVIAFDAHGNVQQIFPIAITHCITPDASDLNNAVIGSAYGSPRQWHILTTEVFGNVVCAEVWHGGNLAYFIH